MKQVVPPLTTLTTVPPPPPPPPLPRACVSADPDRPLLAEVDLKATMLELAKLKAEGKIKHIAVCNFGMEDIKQLLEIGVPIISNQLCYGLLWRGVERGLAKLCEDNGIAIMPWGSLGQGLLCDKFATADDVPAGRARSRIFSNKRPQQRHGEAGTATSTLFWTNVPRSLHPPRAVCCDLRGTHAYRVLIGACNPMS